MEIDLSQFVRKYYQMDPATEDLLPHGGLLENGMEILIQDQFRRMTLELIHSESPQYGQYLENARRWNRWMIVENVMIDQENVYFVGVFRDGTKKKYNVGFQEAWYVKLDSLANIDV